MHVYIALFRTVLGAFLHLLVEHSVCYVEEYVGELGIVEANKKVNF